MKGLNKVMLIGNLGKDPVVQYTEGDIPFVKIPLATTETYRDARGNFVQETEWHTVVLWRRLAELTGKFLHKGSLVYIEGHLRTKSWEDKDKIRKFYTEIIADSLLMLDKKKDQDRDSNSNFYNGNHNSSSREEDGSTSARHDDMGDILPF